jgi:NADP-dependent 3-hydroxy acid dehydrogenase YdfG
MTQKPPPRTAGHGLLAGKRVLVTAAAGTGIGFAAARRCAEEGARVMLSDAHERRVGEAAAQLEELTGVRPPARRCDVTREDDVRALVEAAVAELGHVDVLVNNAGLGRAAPLGSSPSAPWREMLEVNVLGLAIATREAIQDMERRGVAGHVVHVSSMAGHRIPGPDSGMYAATKFAVRALTEALRQELRARKSPIRVTAISPGHVRTEFADVFNGTPGAADALAARLKPLDAADVARAILWAVTQPPHVEVHDVLVRPTAQKN